MATADQKYPNRLRQAIKQSGFTVEGIAAETDVPLRTLFDYCAGRVPVPKERLEVLARALGFPTAYLVPTYADMNNLALLQSESRQDNVGHVSVGLMGVELLDRFYRALKKPSTIDERFLNYLEVHSGSYWRDHYHASLASNDLLSYVREHFQKITELLEGPLLPAARIRLCSIASGTALLVGTLFFDIADYKHSRSFFEATIRSAQEANDYTLQAIGQGWMGLAWTYGGNLQEALACIQAARHLAMLSNSITVRAWLAAVDAEAQAKLHNDDACRKALDEAACLEDPEKPEQIHYWTSYDYVQFEGYKGICFRLLYQSEKRQKRSYLTEAQRVLKEALGHTDLVIIRLRPTFLSDLASTYVQQREFEEACRLAQQALITNASQSQMIVQRVLALRQDLEPYKNTQEVKNLDTLLMPFLTPSRSYRGIV
jgi:tetratricopeptide (TPR) repeat protein